MERIVLAAAIVVGVIAMAAALAALMRAPRQNARARLTPALVILTGGAAITFAAYLAFQIRCTGTGCRAGAGSGPFELDRWWHSESTWEWGAQLLVASVGLIASSLAFWLSARANRWARPPLWAARLLYFTWAVFVFVVPAAYELTT